MNKGTRKMAIRLGFPVLGIVVSSVFSYLITKGMVKVALDREMPKSMVKAQKYVNGSEDTKELMRKLKKSAEKLENSGCKVVEIISSDGNRLIGHWRACEQAQRIIIAMHGWRSSWANDFGAIADFWYENKCSVLYAEQRGQNNSGGEYMGFGLLERFDCLDWINWANTNCSNDLPIYLGGISMGASSVLMAAGFELEKKVHGIVADCGYTSPGAIWKHVAKNNLHMPYNSIRGKIANDLCRKKIQIGAKEYSCIDAMKKCKVPVLFIHGTEDHFVPIEMTYENYRACVAQKRLFVVPGAEHGMSYFVDKEGYETSVKQFWHDFD